jgi:hypothetical protein
LRTSRWAVSTHGQAGRPLASVLLAVEEDADLGAVADGADPVHALLERTALHVRRSV